jgi:hypothetical protein
MARIEFALVEIREQARIALGDRVRCLPITQRRFPLALHRCVWSVSMASSRRLDKMSVAIVSALEVTELRARLIALGLGPTGTTPERLAWLASIMAPDTAHWAPIIKASGFSPGAPMCFGGNRPFRVRIFRVPIDRQ